MIINLPLGCMSYCEADIISKTSTKINGLFDVVLLSYREGVNVTLIIDQINFINDLYVDMLELVNKGDIASAKIVSDECIFQCDSMIYEINLLIDVSIKNRLNYINADILYRRILTIIIIICSYIMWIVFKRNYYDRMNGKNIIR